MFKAPNTRKEPRNKAFLALAVPNVLTNLVVPMAGLIDTMFLGHLPQLSALAGVALGSLIFDFTYISFNFLRMGTTGLTARAVGAEDHRESSAIFFRSMVIALICGLTLVLLQTPIANLGFSILQGDDASEAAGRSYVLARIWGAPAVLMSYVLLGRFLGRGNVRAALLYSIVINAVNIILDYYFIYVLKQGALGAGRATMIAEFSACAFGLFLTWRLWDNHPGFEWQFLKEKMAPLLKLQGNLMIRSICLIGTFSFFTNAFALFGTVALATASIMVRLLNTAAYFIDGYAFALETLAGQYHGAQKIEPQRRALTMALLWNLGTVILFNLGFILFGSEIFSLMTKHPEAIDLAKPFFPYLAMALVFSGFAYIFDGYFAGLAKGHILRKAMIISSFVGFLPLGLLAVHLKSMHLLWIALISFMLFRTVTLAIETYKNKRDLTLEDV